MPRTSAERGRGSGSRKTGLRASRSRRSAAPDSRGLARLERWFQNEVAHPHEDGRAGAAAERSILPSAHLSPAERVDIYSRMYLARLQECLADDYPAVVKLSGHATFWKLARAYLKQHPSRHYSLNVLGRKLPEFLDEPRRLPRRAVLADIARVERAISEAFDATVSTSMTPADMALVPPRAWETGKIRLTESLRLLELDHRANAIVSACRQDKEVPSLGRSRTWLAVYRKEWTVWRADLSEPMHAVLAALQDGRPLPAALASAAKSFSGTPEAMQAEVHRWFGEWAGEGLFVSVER
jgi:hypothetical protein